MHIVLNNSSKFNLTFRRVEKKTEKNSKKEKKFQKRKKKSSEKVVLRVIFFLWEDRLDFFKVLIYKNCIVKEYFLLESRPFFLAMFW